MAQPWQTLDEIETDDGPMALRRRGERDFLITLSGRVLMNSTANRSELALARLACRDVPNPSAPRVLIGGLGMGCTLRAALDALPAAAHVHVSELHATVADWCAAALAPVNGAALEDPRVAVAVENVADRIERAASEGRSARFDAIVLDLYEGPHSRTDAERDRLYGRRAIESTRRALTKKGRFAVWSEARDAGFESRLRRAGFEVTRHRPGRGGLRHAVYVAERV